MTDDLRALLTEVAEGRLDPQEAGRRLDDLGPRAAAPTDTTTTTGPGPDAATDPWAAATDHDGAGAAAPDHDRPHEAGARVENGDQPVTTVRVHASGRPLRVVADPTVATVTVEGPHNVRRDGATLVVDAPIAGSADPAGSYRYERKTGFARWISQATQAGIPLTLRVNPDLELDVEVLAGSLAVSGTHGPLRFSATAGSVRVFDCDGPVHGTVRAGSARLDVRPRTGSSSVRVETGSVDLRLLPGSDARVLARAELGEVKLRTPDGSTSRVVDREGSHEVVVGSGTATFELDAVMGSVLVRTS
jgi:hypothetical protein